LNFNQLSLRSIRELSGALHFEREAWEGTTYSRLVLI